MVEKIQSSKVWYKEPWPWILMAGPIIVVFASIATYVIAQRTNSDLVTDDYYKEGKYISIQLERDNEAKKRNIHAQLLISPEFDAAKIFLTGNFDRQQPVDLLLIHPASKSLDQKVRLQMTPGTSGDKAEYTAVFKPLPRTQHWYVQLEDAAGVWRVEDKWIVSQGNALKLDPMSKLKAKEASTASAL